jgi:putative oxygen-independent coproporphyrinogen III oxidase
MISSSAYIHVPFCRRRCHYCDFPIEVIGNRLQAKTTTIDEYINILCREIAIVYSKNIDRIIPLKTVFFGGGTPSLLSASQLDKIINCLQKYFGIVADAEISIEIDPGTFDSEKLRGYRDSGVTRFSLGVQAFDRELLKICGRSHSVEDIYNSVAIIDRVGIVNYSLDLISGLPQQTIELWQDALQKAIDLQPKHLSCYDLVLEETTAFGKRYQSGETPLPSDEIAAQMYRLASQILRENGYEHYEISNYAKVGYQCRHNRVYWENLSYYGFGMGAASYIDNQRFTRPQQKTDYFLWVEELAKNRGNIDIPQLSSQDIFLETLMLGLRLAEGIDLLELGKKFGRETIELLIQKLEVYYRQGWVKYRDRQNRIIEVDRSISFSSLPSSLFLHLQDPEGFLFSNTILAALFAEEFRGIEDSQT